MSKAAAVAREQGLGLNSAQAPEFSLLADDEGKSPATPSRFADNLSRGVSGQSSFFGFDVADEDASTLDLGRLGDGQLVVPPSLLLGRRSNTQMTHSATYSASSTYASFNEIRSQAQPVVVQDVLASPPCRHKRALSLPDSPQIGASQHLHTQSQCTSPHEQLTFVRSNSDRRHRHHQKHHSATLYVESNSRSVSMSTTVSPPVERRRAAIDYIWRQRVMRSKQKAALASRKQDEVAQEMVDKMPDITAEDLSVEGVIHDGNVGGVYRVRDVLGRKWIFKPKDEEGFVVNKNKTAPGEQDGKTGKDEEQDPAPSPQQATTVMVNSTSTNSNNSSSNSMVRVTNNDPQNRKLQVADKDKLALFSGVVYGDGAKKEIAAYYLDHGHFSGVPKTWPMHVSVPSINSTELGRALSLKITSNTLITPEEKRQMLQAETKQQKKVTEEYQLKFGTLQAFQEHFGSAEDMGSSLFSAAEVQKIGILDVRLFNLDRHLGNILVSRDEDTGEYRLTPIDHGYILPDVRELGEANFEWMYWKQCKEPFTPKSLAYIKSLDPYQDALILKSLGIAQPAILTCVTTTILLQYAANAGLTLYSIASMTQRTGFREKPSVLEEIVNTALAKCSIFQDGQDLDQLQLPLPERSIVIPDMSEELFMDGSSPASASPVTPQPALQQTQSDSAVLTTQEAAREAKRTPPSDPLAATAPSPDALPQLAPLTLERSASPVVQHQRRNFGHNNSGASADNADPKQGSWSEWLVRYFECVSEAMHVEIKKRSDEMKKKEQASKREAEPMIQVIQKPKVPIITPMLSPLRRPTLSGLDELPSLDLTL